MKAFFDRMQKESKEKEEAYKERIRQLFNEHINVDYFRRTQRDYVSIHV